MWLNKARQMKLTSEGKTFLFEIFAKFCVICIV